MKVTCFVCGKPVDKWFEAHWCHEESCPNYERALTDDNSRVPCDCDLNAHAECCPVCNKKERENK